MTLIRPTISTQIVRHVRDCLELAGVASAPLLEKHGIRPDIVDDREANVPLSDYVRFFEDAATATGNPHFGLHAARVMSSDGLGPLSFLFLSAPTLGQAFQTFTECLDAMQEATFNAFEVQGELCHFTYSIRDSAIVQRRQDTEYSLGVMCNLTRQFVGRRSAPAEVHFEHERQGPFSWYENYFDCPVYFEQPHNRLYLQSVLLERGSTALSSELFPIISAHLRLRMHGQDYDRPCAEQVRDILFSSPAEALPGLDQTAAKLGCSRATLMRRLAKEGASFGDLLIDRRMEFAASLLAGSHRSIADIALATGYAEAASFTRAFRNRIGQPPSAWRRSQKGAANAGRTG